MPAVAEPKAAKPAKTRSRSEQRRVAIQKGGPIPVFAAGSEPVAVNFRPTADLFKLAADPTRLQILVLLMEGSNNVGDLCRLTGATSQPAVSYHISLLRAGRLIEPHRNGQFNYYSLTDAGRRLANTAAGFLAGV